MAALPPPGSLYEEETCNNIYWQKFCSVPDKIQEPKMDQGPCGKGFS